MTTLYPTGSFFPAQTGGPDNTVYWITKALTKQGHQAIISSTDRGLPASVPRGQWLKTEYGEAMYSHNAVHYLPLKTIWRALGRLREVDALHLSMITYPASFLLAILNSWFYGKPMLWSSRGDLDPPMLLRSRKKKAFVLWLINALVNKQRLWFHSTCDAETTYIRNNFGAAAKVIQIPNYMELPTKVEVSREKYFLFIGRIDPKKAIENLLTALAESPRFLQGEFILKIVGDHHNAYGESLQQQVADSGLTHKVQFLGHQAGDKKQALLAGAWFTFMPSHTENFGIVVTEALAQGTPAVASTGTPWQVLEETEAGFWVDNDPATLTATVEKVLDLSPEQLDRMRKNAYRLATNSFSIHANVAEWERAYQDIVTSSVASPQKTNLS